MKILFFYLILINIFGFALFGIDKYRAIRKKWRIRESFLLATAFLGGSIGCLAGMYFFRHKTRHKKFTIFIPMFLCLQLVLAITLYHYIK